MPRKTRLFAHPNRPNNVRQGGNKPVYGYTNPVPSGTVGRIDQGVDITGPAGTPVYAIADEKLLGVLPNWFRGQPFYYFRETGTGIINYVAEQFRSNIKVGQTFTAGQKIGEIAPSGTGLELGFAKSLADARSGHPTPGYTEGQATTLGRQYRQTVITGSSTSQQAAIQQAATTWEVPVNILTGVYGIETDFGNNIATSNAGAIGAFQFLPSTAKEVGGYPLTNTPNAQQFAQQANAAAKYLHQLNVAHGGDWNAALLAYSGGGYGLVQVQNKAGRSRSFGGAATTPRTRPGGTSSSTGTDDGPDVTKVLSDWASARDGEATSDSGNQFVSFGPGWIPTPLGLIPNPFSLSKGLSESIHDTKDFFKLLAWIINPINILRMVEFLAGLVFMAFGFQAMLRAYNERSGGLSSGGLARVSREVSRTATTAVAPEVTATTKATGAAKMAKSTTKGTGKPKRKPKGRVAEREKLNVG